MRSFLSLFLIGMVIVTELLPQSNVSNYVTIKGPKMIAQERQPELFLPKDEFETDAEYQARIQKQNQLIAKVKAELEAKRQAKIAAAERERQAKIAASRQAVEFKLEDIGTYDANNETFPIRLNNTDYTVKIPRAEARSFKENYQQVKIEGYKQLIINLNDWEFFNLAAIHPITGNRYPFGPQKQIDGLATTPIPTPKPQKITPPELTMLLVFVEPNGNGFLDAGEKGQLKVTITNNGKGSAIGVSVNLKPVDKDAGVSYESSKLIGEIPAGQSRSTVLEISANKNVQRKVNQFTISANETYGYPPDPVQVQFETYPFIPPKLELVDYGITTATNETVIKPGVNTEVQVRIQNRGQGVAEKVNFKINLPLGVYFTPESQTEYTFNMLRPGEYKDLVFSINPSKNVAGEFEIRIAFTEENTHGVLPLRLAVKKPEKTLPPIVITGKDPSQVPVTDVPALSVDIEKDIPVSKKTNDQDYAVVLGIENYKMVPSVSFARHDAQWMKTYFEKVFGIPASNIYFRTDNDVSLAEFKVAFSGWLQKRVQKGVSNVYVYYAGHGAPDIKRKKGYLIPYDGNPNYPEQTGYELERLYADLNALGAKSVTVFLDACFSGANRDNQILISDARPITIEIERTYVGDATVFTATSEAQIASAWPEKKHGLFSYFLMKGLKGEADGNRDRKITVKELSDYLQSNIERTAGLLDREQTPQIFTPEWERVLVSY